MMDFPKDKKVLDMDTEYMFGRNFLVRPVTDSLYTWQDKKQNGHQKDMSKIGKTDVYLPKVPAGSTSGPGKHWKADRPCNVKSRLTLCRSTSVPALFSLGGSPCNTLRKRNGTI